MKYPKTAISSVLSFNQQPSAKGKEPGADGKAKIKSFRAAPLVLKFQAGTGMVTHIDVRR